MAKDPKTIAPKVRGQGLALLKTNGVVVGMSTQARSAMQQLRTRPQTKSFTYGRASDSRTKDGQVLR
jgi:hypothetical protein